MHLGNSELQLFLEHTPTAVAMFDCAMRYIATSRQWLIDYGLKEQSLIGRCHYEVFPQTSDKWKAIHERCLAGSCDCADSFVRDDGSIEWVKWRCNPWYNQNGEIEGIIFFSEIITEQKHPEGKQVEEALQLSVALLREQVQREQLLNRLGTQIRNSLDIKTVIETAIQEIQQLLHVDYCTFCWYKPDADPPIWEAIAEAKNLDLPSLIGSYPAAVVEPVTQQLLTQEILTGNNVAKFAEPIFRQLSPSVGFQSQITLPIKTLSGEIGVIFCAHCCQPYDWSDSEVELLQAVVDQLAIGVNQAELYTQAYTTAMTAQKQTQQLEQTLEELKKTQTKLVQSEKMSSLGQLVAGVAHEINNPVNFIYGNIAHAGEYTYEILGLLKLYQQAYPQPIPEIREEIDAIDLDFLISDLPKLLASMKVGADRIRAIVRSLRQFSRHDEAEMKEVDIHEGIDSTLMILQNRLKTKPDSPRIEVIKNYGNLPLVQCYPGQLNQVFMNLLVNAIDALEESTFQEKEQINPTIRISTEVLRNNLIAIRVGDNGLGMTQEVQKHLFDPFFTTKPIGVGTGLGLSISYQIVVEKHAGQLYCFSELDQGTEFVIEIPVCQNTQV